MKKVLALFLAVLMVCSMSITAFAEGENVYPTGDGSVTISNATVGKEYKIYQFFDATYSTNTANVVEAVAYTISKDNQFFEALFGADGTTENKFFVFTPITTEPLVGTVTKRASVNDSELIAYLSSLITDDTDMAADAVTASSAVVTFSNLPYGYYMIFSTLGAAVTVTSNTPNVTVIDKNQMPGDGFKKEIAIFNEDGTVKAWTTHNTAAIGDVVRYKISFEATNYYQTEPVKYYQIHDTKQEALWADFDSVKIVVDGEELTKGYFVSLVGGTLDNHFLGNWGTDNNPSNADWYVVHTSGDSFRFTIPWMDGHSFSIDEKGVPALSFPENAASTHKSPVDVEIYYESSVLPTATEGLGMGNMVNKASVGWVTQNYAPVSVESSVYTETFGLGLLKEDAATKDNLAGAEFRIYSDKNCTQPVWIIPTDIEGVYIADSLNTPAERVDQSVDAREKYAAHVTNYLGSNVRDNYMITPVNGKVVVRGLDAGTYYLRETKAPSGYNPLSSTIELTIGSAVSTGFQIFADSTGKVADIRDAQGDFTLKTFHVDTTNVENSKGVELPSTGGEGTMMMITIGTMVALAFAVLLITHKKMSIYHD